MSPSPTGTMQRIVLASRPSGAPVAENFRLEEQPVPAPGNGEILVRIIWLSLDPYMRGRMDEAKSYAKAVEIGDTMEGGTVGEVIASNNPNFAVGDFVMGMFGWCSHAVHDGKCVRKLDPTIAPLSTAVGVLGMPGMTAYVGLREHGRPKEGETLVVGAASGAVGAMVGQLAKAQGLRVVGVAGGADKCAFVKDELGFHDCVDHRPGDTAALRERLAAACPEGVDVYWENVGGKTLQAVLPLMNDFGRIPLCGMIAWYSGASLDDLDPLPKFWRQILVKRLTVRGFIVWDHAELWPDFLRDVAPKISDGTIVYREAVTAGLENAPTAFFELLRGGNFGKQLVQVSDDPTRA